MSRSQQPPTLLATRCQRNGYNEMTMSIRSVLAIVSLLLLQLLSATFLVPSAHAFVSVAPPPCRARFNPYNSVSSLSSTVLGETNRKKSGLEESVKNKLVKESIAPWRPLRLFLYVALGSGAFIGGLVTLSGTLAALSGARSDVDLNTEVRTGFNAGNIVWKLTPKEACMANSSLFVKLVRNDSMLSVCQLGN